MAQSETSLTEELRTLDTKMKQLKLDYEQYFIGSRPREPSMARAEVQKQITRFANTAIKNTAERFKFNALNARFMTFKRQWDDTLRKIEAGTYHRHVFKARLHERERGVTSENPTPKTAAAAPRPGEDLFARYKQAAESCGQSTSGLTPEKLQAVIHKQEAAIKKKMGASKVNFRVEVENGKVKLKATAVKSE